MKKTIFFAVIAAMLLSISGWAFAADDTADERTPLQGLDKVESVVYGQPLTGGLLLRLSKVERDLFGMELPGSLTERQQALQAFVEDGNASQPSLLFKIGVAEWVTLRRTNPSWPLAERIAHLETTLENEKQEGALSARLERIITKLLPGGIAATQVQIPAATVFKAHFVDTLTVRTVEKGDVIALDLDEDCVINGALAVPKGNRLFAEVTKVKMPRSFGRSSEISFEFRDAETLGGKLIPVTIGPEAKKAVEVESGALGAAGASLGGAILLGPVGLAGGFLVRGNDKQIPAGTTVYVETEEFTNADAYTIPNLLNNMQGSSDSTDSQDSSNQEPSQSSDTVVY